MQSAIRHVAYAFRISAYRDLWINFPLQRHRNGVHALRPDEDATPHRPPELISSEFGQGKAPSGMWRFFRHALRGLRLVQYEYG